MASSWHHSKNTEIGIIEELPKRTFRKISGDRSSNFETSGIVVDFRKLLVSERRIIDSVREDLRSNYQKTGFNASVYIYIYVCIYAANIGNCDGLHVVIDSQKATNFIVMVGGVLMISDFKSGSLTCHRWTLRYMPAGCHSRGYIRLRVRKIFQNGYSFAGHKCRWGSEVGVCNIEKSGSRFGIDYERI
ncbi:uncharacterized protein TRIADDRAFT_57825 [Trichoplax adhaerens]|uniref:Uncharacterized protein n=1 Tax=Trichoplax adhaerens TaxID=10228 RepID=B3S1N4_TRIAD|nr:predicted protein [Trichoplax adhaerens]EDV23005.1 predicted protein [Trichoplax adhaerens]|eukprot:XP_002113915.1 predicted protein [Trichoplax adhaerens]